MSTPDLPQPIYPGGPPPTGAVPGAQAPQPPATEGTRPTGYAPVVPGVPAGGGGGRSGGKPGLGRWLIIGGAAAALVVVVVVATVALTRGPAAEGGGTANGGTTPTPDTTATTDTGGSQDPDPDLADTVAGMWAGMATTAEQGCVLEAATADPALAAAINDYYYEGTATASGAALLGGVNVDCLPTSSLEDVILAAPITPTCDWYDFSSLTDAEWRKLLTDGYVTMAGLATADEFAAAWFPGCYFPE